MCNCIFPYTVICRYIQIYSLTYCDKTLTTSGGDEHFPQLNHQMFIDRTPLVNWNMNSCRWHLLIQNRLLHYFNSRNLNCRKSELRKLDTEAYPPKTTGILNLLQSIMLSKLQLPPQTSLWNYMFIYLTLGLKSWSGVSLIELIVWTD